MEKVINAAFLWHNYGNSTIGNRSDIERVPIDNLKAFYKKYYRPDNAILMITGKFEVEKTLALVQKKFGTIKNKTKNKRFSGGKSREKTRKKKYTCYIEPIHKLNRLTGDYDTNFKIILDALFASPL